jgi:hypothetical protein
MRINGEIQGLFEKYELQLRSVSVGMFSDRGRVCVFVIDGKDHDQ